MLSRSWPTNLNIKNAIDSVNETKSDPKNAASIVVLKKEHCVH